MKIFDELTYTDIIENIDNIKAEIENLDDDSLVDELQEVRYHIEGKESEKLERIIFKNHADVDLTEKDRQFLKDLYVLYHSSYAIMVDEEEDDLFDED